MENYKKVERVPGRKNKIQSMTRSTPYASGGQNGTIRFNQAAAEKFKLKSKEHIEVYLGTNEILVEFIEAQTDTSFKFYRDVKGVRFCASPLKLHHGIDLMAIKRQPIHMRDGYLVIPLPASAIAAAPEPEPVEKIYEVRGEIKLFPSIRYVGFEEQASQRLFDFVSGLLPKSFDFDMDDIRSISVEEVKE